MTDRPRFYLDEDVPHATAGVGAELGLDVVSARGAQSSLPRIMVTYNRNDFLLATRDAFASGAPHAGLLILTHKLPRDPARIARALSRWVAERREDGAWPMQAYEVDFLSH